MSKDARLVLIDYSGGRIKSSLMKALHQATCKCTLDTTQEFNQFVLNPSGVAVYSPDTERELEACIAFAAEHDLSVQVVRPGCTLLSDQEFIDSLGL